MRSNPFFIAVIATTIFIAATQASVTAEGSNLLFTKTETSRMDPKFNGTLQNVTATVGRRATLSCTIENLGAHKIGWMKAEDQTILTFHERVVSSSGRFSVSHENNRTWYLHIRDVEETDKGCYMCQVNTIEMQKQIGCLDVLVPPDIITDESSADLTLMEGDNATMSCHATGNPEPKITWKRENGQPLMLRTGSRDLAKHEAYIHDADPIADFSDDSEGEDEVILPNDHSSDSDLSVDEEGPPPSVSLDYNQTIDDNSKFDVFMGKNGETFWFSNSLALPKQKTKSKNIIKIMPGPTRFSREAKSEKDIFLKYFPLEIIDKIVLYTNKFIDKRAAKVQNRCIELNNEFRIREFKTTTRDEILAFIGILYYMATCKISRANAKSFWKTDGTGMVLFRAVFSYNRFFFLLQALRFDDLDTRAERQQSDKLAAVREMYTTFNENCMKNYCPSEFVTIDEILYAFRGRCGFIQYMPAKPAKYGIKMYALCDAKTFYVHNFEVYCGKQKPGRFLVSNKPHDIVMRLIGPLKNSKRNLTTDNYYGSYPLAQELLKKSITLLTTLKKNKADIPPEFLLNPKRTVKSSLFGYQDECTLVSYVPKKNKSVILLSTMHDGAGEINEETGKPEIIHDYNRTKCGVDTVDQKCSVASTARNTRRWPLALFFRFLDMAGVNSHILYVTNNMSAYDNKTFRRFHFLQRLAIGLMEDHLKKRAKVKGLPKDVQYFLAKYKNYEDDSSASQGEYLTRSGACHTCGTRKNNKTTVRCSLCTRFVCKKHCDSTIKCHSCNNSDISDASMEG